MSDLENKVYDWDDEWEVETDGNDFFLPKAGEYPFTIKGFERGHYTPSDKSKLPECGMAVFVFEVMAEDKNGNIGVATIKDNFHMCSTMEWKISNLLRATGDKKHGEKAVFRVNEMVGKTGILKIKLSKGTKDDVYFANIDKYVDKNEEKESALRERYSLDNAEMDW